VTDPGFPRLVHPDGAPMTVDAWHRRERAQSIFVDGGRRPLALTIADREPTTSIVPGVGSPHAWRLAPNAG